MTNTILDLTKPREPVYQSSDGDPGACPRCGSILHQVYQSYTVATRRAGKVRDSFIIGGDIGWFCESCPVVVIDTKKLATMLGHSLPHWDVGNEYVVLGLVDLDAVPPDKRDVPLGEDDNPIPLIEFRVDSEHSSQSDHSSQSSFERRRRQKLLERKLERRRKVRSP